MSKRSFYPQDELDQMHALLLDVLCESRNVCDRHGLRYYLYCGTLLGCIRHGGFIPWDDDIDIAMPAEDYKKFLEIAPQEMPSWCAVQDLYHTKGYPYVWAKVSRNGTTLMDTDYRNSGMHMGIAVDIYPFLGIPENKVLASLQRFAVEAARQTSRVHLLRKVPAMRTSTARKLCVYLPVHTLRLIGKLLYKAAMLDPDKHTKACTVDAAPFVPKYNWKDWQETTTASFDGEMFTIPANYDKLLRIMYGDYMKLPPEEKRVGHLPNPDHTIIDFNKDYREYI